ncbi:hypothetical protein [Rhodococcus sp. ACPA1]|uniref:hypothetical protein n=1 Tax=Rhodococcus sp. ACPA1 TaxID=2028572 RepID=UPI0015C947E6|nr:hypothetical protein [Rhodococcus sp. ACPA1]
MHGRTGSLAVILRCGGAGLLLGFFGYVPAVILWQHYGNVPQPRVYPYGSFTSFGPDPPLASYWVSWRAQLVVVVACGPMTVPWRSARQFALPLVCAFVPMAAMAAAWARVYSSLLSRMGMRGR